MRVFVLIESQTVPRILVGPGAADEGVPAPNSTAAAGARQVQKAVGPAIRVAGLLLRRATYSGVSTGGASSGRRAASTSSWRIAS